MLGFIRMKTKTVIQKTNAARLLDRAGIDYKLVPYEVDEQNLAADHVASSRFSKPLCSTATRRGISYA